MLLKLTDNPSQNSETRSVQVSHSVMSDSATPWITARQASVSITNSWSPPKPMSIESVMPSNHLILCHPLLLEWYTQMKTKWWELGLNAAELKITHGAKWASSLIYAIYDINSSHNKVIILLHLTLWDGPFLKLSKSKCRIILRAGGALPSVICTQPRLMTHS